MQSKLPDLVDKLSGINAKEGQWCMERTKVKWKCGFIGFRNDRLNFKYKEGGKRCSKLINEASRNVSTMHQFYSGDLNKLVFVVKKSWLAL